MIATTTLARIHTHLPGTTPYFGERMWVRLLAHLGKTKADDEPLTIAQILESNGFEDALWCLRAVDGLDRECRLYAVWCARQVQHLMTAHSIQTLDVAEQFANGLASPEQLNAVGEDDWENEEYQDNVAGAAWEAARAAAGKAAWGAALCAAGATAQNIVGAKAKAAARDAAKATQTTEFIRRFCTQEVPA